MNRLEQDNDVILIELGDLLNVDLQIAKELVDRRLKIMKDTMHYMILDVSNIRRVSPEAKVYLQEKEGGLKNILGAAFLAGDPVSALIANIFAKTPKEFDAKFFSSRRNAIKWILEYKKKNMKKSADENR
ncbi:MAG TPA: hypothetical protein VD884_22925 [Ohtaekwangia sp.]|nr:hypothetical protein [Ohtaekwangia sp.]